MLIYNPKAERCSVPATVAESSAKIITIIGDDHGCTIQIVSDYGDVKTISVVSGETLCVVE